jgi:hypothetical protein
LATSKLASTSGEIPLGSEGLDLDDVVVIPLTELQIGLPRVDLENLEVGLEVHIVLLHEPRGVPPPAAAAPLGLLLLGPDGPLREPPRLRMLGEAREERAAAHGSVVAASGREEWEAGVSREDEMVNEVGERGRSGPFIWLVVWRAVDAGRCRGAWWVGSARQLEVACTGLTRSDGGRDGKRYSTERRPTVSYSIMVWSNDAVADSTYGMASAGESTEATGNIAVIKCMGILPPTDGGCRREIERHRPEKKPRCLPHFPIDFGTFPCWSPALDRRRCRGLSGVPVENNPPVPTETPPERRKGDAHASGHGTVSLVTFFLVLHTGRYIVRDTNVFCTVPFPKPPPPPPGNAVRFHFDGLDM